MTKPLAPKTKVWKSEDGSIEIEMISYRTVYIDRVRDALRQYKYEDGTLSDSLSLFILCAGSTVESRLLVDEPPLWAEWLHSVAKEGFARKNPVKAYESLADAPSIVTDKWWQAYEDTRDNALLAPDVLQTPSPLPPEALFLNGEDDPDKLNFQESSTSNGGENLIVMSSPAPDKRSIAPARKAK